MSRSVQFPNSEWQELGGLISNGLQGLARININCYVPIWKCSGPRLQHIKLNPAAPADSKILPKVPFRCYFSTKPVISRGPCPGPSLQQLSQISLGSPRLGVRTVISVVLPGDTNSVIRVQNLLVLRALCVAAGAKACSKGCGPASFTVGSRLLWGLHTLTQHVIDIYYCLTGHIDELKFCQYQFIQHHGRMRSPWETTRSLWLVAQCLWNVLSSDSEMRIHGPPLPCTDFYSTLHSMVYSYVTVCSVTHLEGL